MIQLVERIQIHQKFPLCDKNSLSYDVTGVFFGTRVKYTVIWVCCIWPRVPQIFAGSTFRLNIICLELKVEEAIRDRFLWISFSEEPGVKYTKILVFLCFFCCIWPRVPQIFVRPTFRLDIICLEFKEDSDSPKIFILRQKLTKLWRYRCFFRVSAQKTVLMPWEICQRPSQLEDYKSFKTKRTIGFGRTERIERC